MPGFVTSCGQGKGDGAANYYADRGGATKWDEGMGRIAFLRSAPVIGGLLLAELGLVVSLAVFASRQGRFLASAVYFLAGICTWAAGWALARAVARTRVPLRARLRLAISSGEALLGAARGLLHEFLNHLQVLQGMMQLGKPDQARDCLTRLVEQLTRRAGVLRLASGELALLLLGVREVAGQEGVVVEIDVGTSMERSAVTVSRLCRILYRILEKMLVGVMRGEKFERRLEVALSESEGSYVVRVRGRTAAPDSPPAVILCRQVEREILAARRSGCRLRVSRSAGGCIDCLLNVPVAPGLEYGEPRAVVELAAEKSGE